MDNICKGCHDNFCMFEVEDKSTCPCQTCLIKSMCAVPCEEFFEAYKEGADFDEYKQRQIRVYN